MFALKLAEEAYGLKNASANARPESAYPPSSIRARRFLSGSNGASRRAARTTEIAPNIAGKA